MKSPSFIRAWHGRASALAVLALAGGFACASVPPPRQELAQAQEKVQSAEREQAAQYAPLELRKAKDNLDGAESAMRGERYLEARRKSDLAKSQADLALAKTQRARVQSAVDELNQTVSALEDEIRSVSGGEIIQ